MMRMMQNEILWLNMMKTSIIYMDFSVKVKILSENNISRKH